MNKKSYDIEAEIKRLCKQVTELCETSNKLTEIILDQETEIAKLRASSAKTCSKSTTQNSELNRPNFSADER